MPTDSSILNRLVETSTENTLEYLKQQQRVIQRQLVEQEVMNKNLYESLFKFGLLNNQNSLTTTSSSSQAYETSTTFLDSLKQKFNNFNSVATTSSNPGVFTSPMSNLNSQLSSLLPFPDMLKGMGSVLNKLFGSEYWMYWLLALLMGAVFTCLACCCVYCCCCTRLGRSLMCCCKCSGISSSSSKKKKLSNESNKSKCCIWSINITI